MTEAALPTGESQRRALVKAARRSIRHGSKSFALASALFDRRTREHAWLLYAWCRACDDLADGQVMGHGMHVVPDPATRLAFIRDKTTLALAGEPTGEAAFDGFGLVARECAIPRGLAEDLIGGFALDTEGWKPRSENALYLYCYHVAGVVGIMMALVMGVSPDDEATLDRACDLGMAFQLANIARDIREDGAAGRCYLPVSWLAEMNIPPGEQFHPAHRHRLAMLAQRLTNRAAAYEASGRAGTAALPFRAAWAVLAAAGIYGDIGRAVAKAGESAWDRRVTISKAAKVAWVGKAFVQALRRRPSGNRPPELWTRPRE